MEQYIGKLLDGRYEVLEVIGTGGMAVVYKARCHRLNRLVAIKVLKSDLARDEEFRRRFHDESQAVAMLSHPNIVAVYDVSKASELEYIVMELIDGITLKQYMQKKEGPLNWREALHFITQIMKALSHAHSRGIIHRDIKPHNIMVLRDGSVKVADFGIARLASASHSTLTQEALGSVHYISPEQARGSRVDARSDVYSAGVVLYEMISGRLPFEGDTAVSVAIQHINCIPLMPREINPEVPEALEEITRKAMAPNVEQRYASADAMQVDLEEFRKNPSVNFDYSPALFAKPHLHGDEPTQVLEQTSGERPKFRRGAEASGSDFRSVLLAVSAVLLFVAGIGYFLWLSFFSDILHTPVEISVPSLVGQRIENVLRDETVTTYFEIIEGRRTESHLYKEGEIMSQSPEGGRTVKAGKLIPITVEVSKGEDIVTMPDLLNLEQRVAAFRLKELNYELDIKIETEYSSDITKDYVIRSTPPYGTVLARNQEVVLTVSLGPKIEMVTVPPFIGMSLSKLDEQMRVLKLVLGDVLDGEDESALPDTVIYQSVPAMSEVPEGTVVHVKVNRLQSEAQEDAEEPEEAPLAAREQKTPVVKAIEIALPDNPSVVHVRICVDGATVFDSDVQTDMKTIYPNLQGTGKQKVEIYIDGELFSSSMVEFS